jgi:hypothetical protein
MATCNTLRRSSTLTLVVSVFLASAPLLARFGPCHPEPSSP